MNYNHWVMSHHKFTKARQRQIDELRAKVSRIINHTFTLTRNIADYPDIQAYIMAKFSGVDVSDIPIYIALPEVIEKQGFKGIGGCYIDILKVILVKNRIENKKVRGRFNQLVQKICTSKVDVEDIIIHELIHAVSSRINRSSSKYRHMEEEFVYTNCIEFYKQKGMTEEDIVNNNFLPFCLYDVYQSLEDLTSVFTALGSSLEEIQSMSKAAYSRFLNKNADTIVPMIKKLAQKKAYHMIELYHKYGVDMYLTDMSKPDEDPASLRFSALDFD